MTMDTTSTSRRRSSAGAAAAAQGESQSPPESTEQAFRKLFASVADPQTREHHARHVALTKNVLYQNELGWKLSELPLVAEFLVVLRDKVLDGVEPFATLLLGAVMLCGKPFVRVKSNEELSNSALLTAFVPMLGQLVSFDELVIQVAAADALREFAIGACLKRPTISRNQTTDGSAGDDLRLPTRVYAQNIMEETGTVDLIVGVFHDLFPDDDTEEQRQDEPSTEEQDPRPLTPTTKLEGDLIASSPTDSAMQRQRHERFTQLLFPLVDLVYELSSHQRCAEVLVVTGALHYIVFVLGSLVTTPQDELLPLCLTTLWNVLELSDEKMRTMTTCASRRELLVHFRLRNATYFLSTEFTFQVLQQTLELLLQHGFRRQDKELRNECLMVLLLLARRSPSLDLFYSTGVTTCLLSYATSSELARKKLPPSSSSTIVADSHHYATNADEDLEFKQTLWLLVAAISTGHADNLQAIVQFRFLDVLVEYATNTSTQKDFPANKQPTANTSTKATQYSGAQLLLLQTTALTVLTSVAPFLLDHFYEIHAHMRLLEFLQLAVGSEDVLTTAWQLLGHVAPPLPHIQDELGRLGGVETALAAFDTPPSRHTYAKRRNAIIACASMCRNHDRNRQRFYLGDGVNATAKHLELDGAHVVMEEHLVVGVIEAVRSCVIGYSESELAFLRADGVLRLLDVLEKVPKALKHQVLAALAEITVNPAAIPSFTGWRSGKKESNNATASQVLLRLYAQEEAIEEKQLTPVASSHNDDSDTSLVAASNLRTSAFQSIITCTAPLVVFPPNAVEDLSSSAVSPTDIRPASPAFARLKEALKAGQSKTTAHKKSLLDMGDDDAHPQLNLKTKIHAVLENLSFVCERLSPKERMVLEIAKEFPTFRVGEMWQNVERTLHAEGVRPIYADALYIRRQIEHAYNIAMCTKHTQQDITMRDAESGTTREQRFFQGILHQKQQDEQAEMFHRANRRQNSTMQLHLDAKRTRLELLRRQDPTAFAAYEREQRLKIQDPPPVYHEELSTVSQKEQELRGRLSTIQIAPH